MENKSATKTPKTVRAWTKSGGEQKGGGSNKKELVTIRRADTIRGEQKGNSKQKGTDPKISPCKRYVAMITAA